MSFAGPRFSDRLSAMHSPLSSPQHLASSFYSSLFLMMILSEQQLAQSGLQSLLLYWLGVKLNIFLCTLLLNKDLHSSALCACVSLHTPRLFVCSNRRFLVRPSYLPNFGVSPLFWSQRGDLLSPLLEPKFYPKDFFSQGGEGTKEKLHGSTGGAGALIILAISSRVGKVPLYCHPGEFTADNQCFSQQRPNFLSKQPFETYLRFSSLYLSKKKIVHYNQPSFTFLPWKGAHRSVLSMCKYNRNVTKLNFL